MDHTEAWRRLWEKRGTLWTEAALDRIERDVREQVAADQGAPADRASFPVEVVDAGVTSGSDWVGPGRDGPTLDEIGQEFGVCRERARCIVLQALRAFADAWRKLNPRDPLPWILFGNEQEQRARAVLSSVVLDAAIETAKRGEAEKMAA